MRKLLLGICHFFSWILLTQCGSVPPTYYYRIDYELSELDARNTIIPITIAVKQFDADILYEGDRIVYRNSPYEVRYYHYRRWIAPPRKIVTEKVLQQFQASGFFKRVVSIPSPVKIDYLLQGKINAFEEWDEGDSWYGIVSLVFELQNPETKEIVWEDEFSEKTIALKREPIAVVKAISESLKKVIQKAIKEIIQNLKYANVG